MSTTLSAAIRGFDLDGPHGFLSNFDETPFVLHGRECKSGEHAFQAEKFRLTAPGHYEVVLAAPTPGKAKYHGRNRAFPIPSDWDAGASLLAMTRTVRAKFTQNPDLAERLLATGDALLVEDTTWHDNLWANCVCGDKPRCAKPGQNLLGQVLMMVRASLREE